MPETNSKNAATLDEVMVAMDVVDTLRHQKDIALRELDREGRRQRLLEKLRDIYKNQGIEVSDAVLQQGIQALEQERFQYKAPESSWRLRLAGIWVSRKRWKKPVGFLTVLGGLFGGVYVATDVLPERAMKAALPVEIGQSINSVIPITRNPELLKSMQSQSELIDQALAEEDFDEVERLKTNLEREIETIKGEYTIRVVARPGENSGLWRIPDANENARNYYIVVEAIDQNGKVGKMRILNEETNKIDWVDKWGIRVDERIFNRIAADKSDDGIIQANRVGEKQRGFVRPKYSIETSGAAITKWERWN